MNPIDSEVSVSLPTPLLEAEWLASHLDDPNLRILDATVHVKLFPIPRIKSGRTEWKRGHIPGSRVRRSQEALRSEPAVLYLHTSHGRAFLGGDGGDWNRCGFAGRDL